MLNFTKSKNSIEAELYNKILSLARNKFFYKELSLKDTFENRIYLIFLHFSFLLIKINNVKNEPLYNKFYQNLFDFIFKQIEVDMRESGYGDVTVNKDMKILVKDFYNILFFCEKFYKMTSDEKCIYLRKFLYIVDNKNTSKTYQLVEYFDKYQSFCFYLTLDSVLKGELNFVYK